MQQLSSSFYSDAGEGPHTLTLAPGHELRLAVPASSSQPLEATLVRGTASVLGVPLQPGRTYSWPPGAAVALATAHGAQLRVEGACHCYVEAAHDARQWEAAYDHCVEARRRAGVKPRVLVAGAPGAGLTWLARTLVAHAAAAGWAPLLVDMDVGSDWGVAPLPGTLAAGLLDPVRGVGVEGLAPPLELLAVAAGSCGDGSSAPSSLHAHALHTLLRALAPAVEAAGCIVHSAGCSGDADPAYRLLVEAARGLGVDTVVVIGSDRLAADLLRDLQAGGRHIACVRLRRAGGAEARSRAAAAAAAAARIQQYFTGGSCAVLPASVPLVELRHRQLGAHLLPSGAGSQLLAPLTLRPLALTGCRQPLAEGELLAVPAAGAAVGDGMDAAAAAGIVAGWVRVAAVDVAAGTVTVDLPPQLVGRPLPALVRVVGAE